MPPEDPRADPESLAARVDPTAASAVTPGEYVAVVGTVEDARADQFPGSLVPSPSAASASPAPTGSPGVEPGGHDSTDDTPRTLFAGTPRPGMVGYGIERLWAYPGSTFTYRNTYTYMNWYRVYQGLASVPFRVADSEGSVLVCPPRRTGVGP